MIRSFTFCVSLFFHLSAESQVIMSPTQGAGQIVGTLSSLGRGIANARTEQKRKAEMEEAENNFGMIVQAGDTLYAQAKYDRAIERYNSALTIRQDQYVKDQIAKSQAQISRVNREVYQVSIDRADSLYAQLNFTEATAEYQNASAIRTQDNYPKEQLLKVKADAERWKKLQFSGLLIADSRSDDFSSRAFSTDPYSDFLKPGDYASVENALTYSSFQKLDGIAIPANTRLIIYSKNFYQGEVLLDITGPAIINNSAFPDKKFLEQTGSKSFEGVYQNLFPQKIRFQSATNMNNWISGSMKITTI